LAHQARLQVAYAFDQLPGLCYTLVVSTRQKTWLALLLLLAFGLRVLRLDFQPLWWDEGWTLYFATTDLAMMVERTALDIHPPFYYALLHAWIALLGPGPISVRFFSVVVGTLSVLLVYLLARRLFGSPTDLSAAFLWAIAPLAVYYSQEVRMYGLAALLGLAAVYLAIRLLAARRVHAAWLGCVAVTALAMYTQYYTAFIPLFLTLYALLVSIRQRSLHPLTRFLSVDVAIFVLYLPWLLFAGSKLAAYVTGKVEHEAYVPLDLITFVAQHLAAFSVGHLAPGQEWLNAAVLLFVALALLGVRTVSIAERQPSIRNSQFAIRNSQFASLLPSHPSPVHLPPEPPLPISSRALRTLAPLRRARFCSAGRGRFGVAVAASTALGYRRQREPGRDFGRVAQRLLHAAALP